MTCSESESRFVAQNRTYFICEHCCKSLRVFRTNLDWNGRKLHKKCWKEVQAQFHADILYESLMKEKDT